MNLFISNFSKTLKIISIFLGIFVVYNIYLIVQHPKITMFQNTNQSNISKVQDYIYHESNDIVLVGSSMSNAIDKTFFKDKVYNLSFSGGSSLTGLELIKKSGKTPKIILIESNIIFERNIDNSFIDSIYTPILWEIRRTIPALQEKYQPLNIIISSIKGNVGKSHGQRMSDNRNETVFNNQMKLKLKNINSKLGNFTEKLTFLKKNIKEFEKKGTKVYFIELPVEKEIQNSLKYKETRKIIQRNFNFLDINVNNGVYQTSDGIHLIYRSAYQISQEILKRIESK